MILLCSTMSRSFFISLTLKVYLYDKTKRGSWLSMSWSILVIHSNLATLGLIGNIAESKMADDWSGRQTFVDWALESYPCPWVTCILPIFGSLSDKNVPGVHHVSKLVVKHLFMRYQRVYEYLFLCTWRLLFGEWRIWKTVQTKCFSCGFSGFCILEYDR